MVNLFIGGETTQGSWGHIPAIPLHERSKWSGTSRNQVFNYEKSHEITIYEVPVFHEIAIFICSYALVADGLENGLFGGRLAEENACTNEVRSSMAKMSRYTVA